MEKTDIRTAFEKIKKDETLAARRVDGNGMSHESRYQNGHLVKSFTPSDTDIATKLLPVYIEHDILADWEVIPISDL